MNLISKLQEAYRQLQTINDTINNSSKNQEGCEKKITVSGVPEEDILITGGMLPLYYTEGLHQPVLSHLERVATLKEKGYLTEEEFNLCKSKLFRNIRH